jgi:hypothetical protein
MMLLLGPAAPIMSKLNVNSPKQSVFNDILDFHNISMSFLLLFM